MTDDPLSAFDEPNDTLTLWLIARLLGCGNHNTAILSALCNHIEASEHTEQKLDGVQELASKWARVAHTLDAAGRGAVNCGPNSGCALMGRPENQWDAVLKHHGLRFPPSEYNNDATTSAAAKCALTDVCPLRGSDATPAPAPAAAPDGAG